MLRTTAPLLLAALLLSAIGALGQTPPPAKTAPQKVSIQVTFVTVKTEDLDALGINFDFLSVPGASATYIRGATDSRASYIYRMLTRTPTPADTYVFPLLPHAAADNVAATFAFDAEVPARAASGVGPVQRDEKVTLIPQVVPGDFVKLVMLSPLSHTQQMPLYTVSSGQQSVFNTAVVIKAQDSTGRGRIQRVSGHIKVAYTTELLMFITPTIVSQTITPAPAVKPHTAQPEPQAQFSGGTAGFSSGSFGFGTGFGPGQPSDVLRSTQWLSSLHWPGGSNINGTIGRPSLVIEALPLPGEMKRIYAL